MPAAPSALPASKSPLDRFQIMATGIDSFDKLLKGDEARSADGSVVKLDGIRYHPSVGLFGVIFGAAGSGKSVFSLQLCSGFARRVMRHGAGAGEDLPHHAVYVTHERRELIKEKIEEHFAFVDDFDVMDEGRGTLAWRTTEPKENSTLTIIQMPLDPQQQRHKLGYLFRLLNEAFCRKSADAHDPKRRLLVCLDNAETISAEAFSELGVPPPTTGPAFYKLLREYCAHHRLNTWFAFEESHAQNLHLEETQIATSGQAYAADIVVRLGLTVFKSGYRERSFEIVKAKNQAFRRGRHHFSIRGAEPGRAGQSKTRSGVVIYPSLPTQLHVLGRRDEPGDKTRTESQTKERAPHSHKLGIAEVDDGVRSNRQAYLDAGTVSVLVSDLDSLASEIGLHFALQSSEPALFLSTLHRESVLREMIEQYSVLEEREARGNFWIVGLVPEHISESKLLKDIERWIDETPKASRVVLDNIYELASKFPLLRDDKHFLTALFELFRSKKVASLVVDMVEVGEGRNPIDKSFAAGLADHVFALRHVEFQSQPRKVFSVLKLAGQHEPPQLWELTQEQDRIHAEDRLEFLKGVLSGKPEPVEVTLSLYADTEGSPLDLYLQTQKAVLGQTFGHKISMHACHPEAYVAFQQSLAAGSIRGLGDCHVISIDETWLEELIERKLLVNIPLKHFDGAGNLWRHDQYVTAAQDLALSALPATALPGAEEEANYAVPDRNNLGVLAYNPNVWFEKLGELPARSVPFLAKWANDRFNNTGKAPERLPWEQGVPGLTWMHLVQLQREFLADKAFDHRELRPMTYRDWEETDRRFLRRLAGLPEFGVFTFSMENRESCVSFFLELLLSVTWDEDFPVNERRRLRWDLPGAASSEIARGKDPNPTAWGDALALLLHLLSPWDLSRLAHGWYRSAHFERPCLFSRQWFSSWGFVGLTQPGLWVLELPQGIGGKPTPVSGAWYLGILRGSTAVPAGARLIKHLTSPEEELHKLNRGIGLPVRKALYEGPDPIEARTNVPYRARFAQLAEIQAAQAREIREQPESRRQWACDPEVIQSRRPFYRSRIQNYSRVSPLLMGLIVRAARTALDPKYETWLWQRGDPLWPDLRDELEDLVRCARARDENDATTAGVRAP